MWKTLFTAALIGILAYGLVVYAGWPELETTGYTTQPQPVTIGKSAPSFSFTSKGQSYKPEDFKDKIVLINFWASWCPPCLEELPIFLEIASEFQNDVVFIGISSDQDEKSMQKALNKMRAKGLAVEQDNVFLAYDKNIRITEDVFGIYGLPATLILDRDLVVRKKLTGTDWDAEKLRSLISSL